ncbi:hypothetical protein ACLKA6_009923 [Drosophila palustris]
MTLCSAFSLVGCHSAYAFSSAVCRLRVAVIALLAAATQFKISSAGVAVAVAVAAFAIRNRILVAPPAAMWIASL